VVAQDDVERTQRGCRAGSGGGQPGEGMTQLRHDRRGGQAVPGNIADRQQQ
jgi:hypothetical protein